MLLIVVHGLLSKVRDIREHTAQRSSSQGLRIPQTPACSSVGAPYTGWTIYGYWLNGTLLNRAEYKQTYYRPTVQDWPLPDVKLKRDAQREERRIRRAAWREQVKHASLSRHEAASALESHLGYAIPTLDDATL